MPALCSKTLQIGVHLQVTDDYYPSIGGWYLVSQGVAAAPLGIFPAGKYDVTWVKPGVTSHSINNYTLDCTGTTYYVSPIGGGDGDCPNWEPIQILPVGAIRGFAMLSLVSLADAESKSTS